MARRQGSVSAVPSVGADGGTRTRICRAGLRRVAACSALGCLPAVCPASCFGHARGAASSCSLRGSGRGCLGSGQDLAELRAAPPPAAARPAPGGSSGSRSAGSPRTAVPGFGTPAPSCVVLGLSGVQWSVPSEAQSPGAVAAQDAGVAWAGAEPARRRASGSRAASLGGRASPGVCWGSQAGGRRVQLGHSLRAWGRSCARGPDHSL